MFAKEDPPIVRLGNAILLNALKAHAAVIYLDREHGVRLKVGSAMRVELDPLGRLFQPTVERLQEMAGTDQRAGTIRLSLASTGMAEFEVRPYGREGLVITVTQNPYRHRTIAG